MLLYSREGILLGAGDGTERIRFDTHTPLPAVAEKPTAYFSSGNHTRQTAKDGRAQTVVIVDVGVI